MLRKTGYDLLSPLNIAFDLQVERILMSSKPPTPAVKHAIHKIYQETIMNIIKHASSTTVRAKITINGKILSLEIEDNGIGFDQEEVESTSFGLENIRKRVDEISGNLCIETQPGMGTRIIVELPIE
jgi:two-component system NarL family sensor kinase